MNTNYLFGPSYFSLHTISAEKPGRATISHYRKQLAYQWLLISCTLSVQRNLAEPQLFTIGIILLTAHYHGSNSRMQIYAMQHCNATTSASSMFSRITNFSEKVN